MVAIFIDLEDTTIGNSLRSHAKFITEQRIYGIKCLVFTMNTAKLQLLNFVNSYL